MNTEGGLAAPLGLRFAASLVDGVFGLLLFVLAVPALEAMGMSAYGTSDPVGILFLLAPYLGLVLYYLAPTARSGQTLGKRMVGIRVVGPGGAPPGWGRAFLREVLGKLLSGILFLGYLLAFLHPERRALHDLVAGTRVVWEPRVP